jgi:hypothetical protein
MKLDEQFVDYLAGKISRLENMDYFRDLEKSMADFYKYYITNSKGRVYLIKFPEYRVTFLFLGDGLHSGSIGNHDDIVKLETILTDYGEINLKQGIMETNLAHEIISVNSFKKN